MALWRHGENSTRSCPRPEINYTLYHRVTRSGMKHGIERRYKVYIRLQAIFIGDVFR